MNTTLFFQVRDGTNSLVTSSLQLPHTSVALMRAGIFWIAFYLLAAALLGIVVHVVIFEKGLAPTLQATVAALGSKYGPSKS